MSLAVPNMPYMTWSMHFMVDWPVDGRQFQRLYVLDEFNREGWGIEVNFLLRAERDIRSLDRIIEWRRKREARNKALSRPRRTPIRATQWLWIYNCDRRKRGNRRCRSQ